MTTDFEVSDLSGHRCFGSICLLVPMTEDAEAWASEYLPDALEWGNAKVIEPRYLPDIIEGITSDGLTVA